ncbi:MAG: HAMP domain-containing histidine kinase [Burkholderiaceae bacterium]|nr:HAMP domain-containing histidine kinase [Ideonella sp.]MCC7287410.1 HAMP domain-containing histidine kinase [Burkholderiaceae bacterium]
MSSLYLRIWLTVVSVLGAFALVSGWFVQRHLENERQRIEGVASERLDAWAELVQRSLPPADAPPDEQAAALRDWSLRLRLPMALDDTAGRRIGAADSYLRREADRGRRGVPVRLDDGRTLWVMRPGLGRAFANQPRDAQREHEMPARAGPMHPAAHWPAAWLPPQWPPGVGLLVLLALLFIAVAAGAYPVVRGLTRRLEGLQRGVERFGAGSLGQRVDEAGRDEVAAVARSFNRAAARVEALVRSHQNLLANASHELRSPLARLKMAVAMLPQADGAQRDRLRREAEANIAELDALVEEVLLASRLDADAWMLKREQVELLGLAAEEAARVDAQASGVPCTVAGDERLLRRALRNLLENARRYGAGEIEVFVEREGAAAQLRICDRGPGVPEAYRERIFEAFFRLPGHAEREGGVGLGLSLVKQIAERHGGSVRCDAREGGGSCFVVTLPV